MFAIFEFVHALVETPKFRGAVKAGLSDLMYYIVLYMQITEEQVRLGSNKCILAEIKSFVQIIFTLLVALLLDCVGTVRITHS